MPSVDKLGRIELSTNFGAQIAATGRTITPDDANQLPGGVCCGIYVGVAGNINVGWVDGTFTIFTNVPVGTLPVKAIQVKAASTTATGLIAMYP